jgi:hypothetical protein
MSAKKGVENKGREKRKSGKRGEGVKVLRKRRVEEIKRGGRLGVIVGTVVRRRKRRRKRKGRRSGGRVGLRFRVRGSWEE